jgi:hypothetical protein
MVFCTTVTGVLATRTEVSAFLEIQLLQQSRTHNTRNYYSKRKEFYEITYPNICTLLLKVSVLKRNLLIEYKKALTKCEKSLVLCILPNFKADAENCKKSQILLTMFKYTINNYLKFLPRNGQCRGPGNVFKVIVCVYGIPKNVFFEISPKRSYIAGERAGRKGRLTNYSIPKNIGQQIFTDFVLLR